MITLGQLTPLFEQRLVDLGYPVTVTNAAPLGAWDGIHYQLDVDGIPAVLAVYLVAGADKDQIRQATEAITAAAMARRAEGVATVTHVQFLETANLYIHLTSTAARSVEPRLSQVMQQFVDHRKLGMALARLQASLQQEKKQP